MADYGRWPLLAGLAALVLIAGCAAPAHDATPTGTETDAGVEVRGAGLPVDPDVVFDRVLRLLNASVPRPDSVQVVGPPEATETSSNGSASGGFDPAPAFFQVMGVDTDPSEGLNATQRRALENGRTDLRFGTLVLYTGANDSRAIEYILAHEFVHYVQAARDRPRELNTRLDATTDSRFVTASLLEGSAVLATDAYIDAHLGGPPSTQLYEWLASEVAAGSFPDYANTRYLQGSEYVAATIGGPEEMEQLYRNPPRTSEQLIHNLEPGSHPPRPLSIDADVGAYRRLGHDRLGEGFLRVVLRNGVSRRAANEAATGWGNDSLRTYRPADGGDPAYAWTIRFDDARNRSQFGAAIRTTLDALGNETGENWELSGSDTAVGVRTVDDTTVTLLAGPSAFVTNTTTAGGDGEVRLGLPRS